MEPRFAARLRPNCDALLRLLARGVDNRMLRSIANADYGYKSDQNYAALCLIRDHLQIANPLPWEPREVLELSRWSDPDHPLAEPEGEGKRGHLARAFCCAVLLRSGGDEGMLDYLCDEADTLVLLLESLGILGERFQQEALRSVTFRVLHYKEIFEDKVLFMTAQLWLVLKCRMDITIARDIANSILEEGGREAKRSQEWHGSACFRLRLGLREERWQSLVADILILTRPDKDLQLRAQQISNAFKKGFWQRVCSP